MTIWLRTIRWSGLNSLLDFEVFIVGWIAWSDARFGACSEILNIENTSIVLSHHRAVMWREYRATEIAWDRRTVHEVQSDNTKESFLMLRGHVVAPRLNRSVDRQCVGICHKDSYQVCSNVPRFPGAIGFTRCCPVYMYIVWRARWPSGSLEEGSPGFRHTMS